MATPDANEATSHRSPWFPVALKVGGIAALLIGLAGIGAASMILGDGGVAVARGAAPATSSAASEARAPAPLASTGPRAPSAGVTADGKVILNLAEADDLRRLPGIGQRRAEAILELRGRLKRFRRVSDLLRVRGIGVRALRRITPLVVLDPPKPPASPDAGADAADGAIH